MRLLERLCQSILVVGALAVGYSFSHACHEIRKEPQQYFTHAMGLSVVGDTERQYRESLNHALSQELSTGDLDVDQIRFFNSRRDFSLPVLLDQLYMDRAPSKAFSVLGISGITLNQNAGYRTMVHEIKHQKHFAANRRDPDFMKKWYAVANDENGNSLYLTPLEEFCYYLRDDVPCADISSKMDLEENQRLGFPTNYARVNVYEHIAELGEMAEVNPFKILELVKLNPRYKDMLRIMEEAEIIPDGFLDYHLLLVDINRVWDMQTSDYRYPNYMVEEAKNAKDDFYLDTTAVFISQHPQSPYVVDIREDRGQIYYTRAEFSEDRSERELNIALAEQEYTAILDFEYKPNDNWGTAIYRLKDLANLEGDYKTAGAFDNWADSYYNQIFNNQDLL